MITREEYEKREKPPIAVDFEEDNINLPMPVVVIIFVLSSLVGVFIVCEAIIGV